MNPETYAAESKIEESHWWFVVRRNLFFREVKRMKLPRNAKILDVGTSTGTNLRFLREGGFTNFIGMDASSEAIHYCSLKGIRNIIGGDVCALPFSKDTFDLVLATDLIEHIDNDLSALNEIARVVRPGGHVLFTVPAFASLWGLQDNASHHKRRYTKVQFNDLILSAGLSIERTFYFNFLLFGPIWAARQFMRIFPPKLNTENDINTPWINAILKVVFEIDCLLAPKLRPPFGVSIFTLASKRLPRLNPGN